MPDSKPKLISQKLVSYKELSAAANARVQTRLEQAKKAERERREQFLDFISRKESELWDKAAEFIEKKKTKEYEKAIQILQALKFKAQETGDIDDYLHKADQLYDRYPTLSGLRWRMQAVGVVSSKEEVNLYKQVCGQKWRESHPADQDISHLLLEEA